MKTFKLISLKIINNDDADMLEKPVTLVDGLIINREDENNQWVIEAYVSQSYADLFQTMYDSQEDVLIEVKITKENNKPATFITFVSDVNRIGDKMNVLFIGTIVDQRKEIIEDELKTLIEQGYQGEALLLKFKEQID